MPRSVLTEPEAGRNDTRPIAGFFGKLPTTGDFVSRRLPDAFRRNWDAWVTRHIAPLHRQGLAFPRAGLRFRLVSGGRLAAGVILPSEDSAGRHFPLSLVLIADGGLTQRQIDIWCDDALELPVLSLTPDDLLRALDDQPTLKAEGLPEGPMQLWTTDCPALTVMPSDPAPALRKLLTA